MVCKNCGDELPKIGPKNRKKDQPIQDLCIRCQLEKLGWKDTNKVKESLKH